MQSLIYSVYKSHMIWHVHLVLRTDVWEQSVQEKKNLVDATVWQGEDWIANPMTRSKETCSPSAE